ncbi:SHOCT domain-containing protein [Aquiflexum sp. TKW24L]|uniref:SHOCT domain-containing protein n=1 Tax=Aquiflexum sp. TKW24L TaxID=2942212 RepID=UPI0020BE8A02|nr:SHOCT domain-containing protein [Aquiflexum sp. TKW24L]MCL6258213.1 SHOCT domain-containing protein [Aquiflexum sp. TKW24L]
MRFTYLRSVALFLAVAIFFASCASTTMIQSNPSDAKLYMNGEYMGNTPYAYRDTKVVGSSTLVKLEKEGYNPFNTSFSRDEELDVGALIGGLFLLVPFLWIMKYKPFRTYTLQPAVGGLDTNYYSIPSGLDKTKADKLRELKKLLDEGVITQEEFEIEKKKILES